MSTLYRKLRVGRQKLAHRDRIQLTLFFKDVGMPVDQAGNMSSSIFYL